MTKKLEQPENTCCEGCFGMVYAPELGRRFVQCHNPRSDHYGHIVDGVIHSCPEWLQTAPQDELWITHGPVVLEAQAIGNAVTPFTEGKKIAGKVPAYVENKIRRAYAGEHLKGPIEELTDRDLLKIKGFGKQCLAELRAWIPASEVKNG